MPDHDPRDHGARGDGSTVDTAALQAAIDLCASRGGRVVLDGGTFVTGTLQLRSGVELHLTRTAVLLGSPDIDDYATDTHHNRYRNESELDRCLLFAQDAEDITLSGTGVIDGNAAAFPNPGDPIGSRPMMIRMLRCRRVRLRDLRLVEAAGWTTAFLDSSRIWVEDLDIDNETNANGDGLDFDGCSDVWVSRCRIRGTDDNLCLQASSPAHPVRNVHISDCHFSSICAGIRIGLKSIGSITDVMITGCTMTDVHREGIKVECSEGGTIARVAVVGTVMHNVRRPVFVLLNNRFEPDGLGSSVELETMPPVGRLEDILISDLIAVDDETMRQTHLRLGRDVMGSPRFNGIRVDAPIGHPIRRLTFRGIHYTSYGGVRVSQIPPDYPTVPDRLAEPDRCGSENYFPDWSRTGQLDVRGVDALTLDDVVLGSLHPDERPAAIVEECRLLSRRLHVLGAVEPADGLTVSLRSGSPC